MALQHEVHTEDGYNWDESPIRLGQYKAIKKGKNITAGHNTSREPCTVGECVSAGGFSFRDALVIFAGERFMQLCGMAKLPGSYQIDVTPNGYHR